MRLASCLTSGPLNHCCTMACCVTAMLVLNSLCAGSGGTITNNNGGGPGTGTASVPLPPPALWDLSCCPSPSDNRKGVWEKQSAWGKSE